MSQFFLIPSVDTFYSLHAIQILFLAFFVSLNKDILPIQEI